MDLLLILNGPRICNLREDTWRKIPHNAPLIRLLLSDWVASELRQNGLIIYLGYLGA